MSSTMQERIKQLVYSARQEIPINQMCEAMEINRTQFYKYYTGRVQCISPDVIVKICRYFGCSADWLLGLEE